MILYEDEDICSYVDYLENVGWFIHTDVKAWSVKKYKKYLTIFGILLEELKQQGITRLYAAPPSKKEEKWQELFGFTYSFNIGDYRIMELNYGN